MGLPYLVILSLLPWEISTNLAVLTWIACSYMLGISFFGLHKLAMFLRDMGGVINDVLCVLDVNHGSNEDKILLRLDYIHRRNKLDYVLCVKG